MDIAVTGRKIHISDDFKAHVTERISGIEKFRDRVQRVEVQVSTGASKVADESCVVEITLIGKGPIVRATGSAEDKTVAFEAALDKLTIQLRKAADRRKHHRGLRSQDMAEAYGTPAAMPEADESAVRTHVVAGDLEMTGEGPLAVREKVFDATPLSLAQALDEMELVGHDFFLYVDAETGRPSVAYKRKGYSYGVIHLQLQD